MIKDDDGSNGSGFEPTRIDLGDDLLEKTAIIPGHAPASEAAGGVELPLSPTSAPDGTPEKQNDPGERIEHAKMLRSEGFPDEAKKVLRQVLIADPHHVPARKLLQEIHESELKEIFGSSEATVRKSFLSTYDDSILHADSEKIVGLLDRDIGLGLENAGKELSFFSDPELLGNFAAKIDRQLGDSVSDRFDLSVGFIEMGIHAVAIRLLQPLLLVSDEGHRLNASALSAYAHLMHGEPYRTIAVLQAVLNDTDIEKAKKTEAFYLMGRAYQAIGAYTEAIGWYLQTLGNETGYRDATERITRCRTALSQK